MFDEDAAVNPTAPYKPRRLKQDQYHRMQREARKHKPPNSVREAHQKRTHEKWERKNHVNLEKRRDFVADQRKARGLASVETNSSTAMTTTVTADTITAHDPRTMLDIRRAIETACENAQAIDRALSIQRRQIAAGFTLSQEDVVTPKTSPLPVSLDTVKLKQSDFKKLTEHHALIRSLYDTQQALYSAASQLQQFFPQETTESRKLYAAMHAAFKSLRGMIEEAEAFVAGLASQTAPAHFVKFADAVNRALSRSIDFDDNPKILAFVYPADPKVGPLVYSSYMCMRNVVDESGDTHADLIVVASYVMDATPTFHVTTMTDYQPPGSFALGPSVPNGNISAALTRIHTLLSMDKIENMVGALPLPLAISQGDLNVKHFQAKSALAGRYLSRLTFDEDDGTLTFYAKSNLPPENRMELVTQLRNMLPLRGTTGQVKYRMTPVPKGQEQPITFYLRRDLDAPKATKDTLSALKVTLNLSDRQVTDILRVVNASAQPAKQQARTFTLPNGTTVNDVQIIEILDECIRSYGKDYMKCLLPRLNKLGVQTTQARMVVEQALGTARYFRAGLDKYVQEIISGRMTQASARETGGLKIQLTRRV